MSTVPPKPKPGGLAFLIPAVIWIAFSIVATVLLVNHISRFGSIIDDFDRVREGETATVALSSGGHTIWLERPGIDQRILYGDEVTVEIEAPDGSDVPTAVYDTDASYSSGGRDGTAALTFNAPVDGDYSISPIVNDFGGGTIAIGTENPNRAIGVGFAYFVGVGTVGFLIALIILIVLLVKRSRSKKAIRAANVAAFGYQQPGYQQPGYGYAGPGQAPAGPYGAPPPHSAPPPPYGSAPPPPGSSDPWSGSGPFGSSPPPPSG